MSGGGSRPSSQSWLVFFVKPEGAELEGGIKTVDTKLFDAVGRIVRVPVRYVSAGDLKAALDDLEGSACCVITHFENCKLEQLQLIHEARSRRKGIHHFHLIHEDPTLATPASLQRQERIKGEVPYYEHVVCLGPRMSTRIRNMLKALFGPEAAHKVIAITGGMERVARPLMLSSADDDHDSRLVVREGPTTGLLRPLPEPTSLRVLFSSPIRDDDQIEGKGLDLFAQAAGIVQRRLLDRRVDITNVVLGAADVSSRTSERQRYLDSLKRQLTVWARPFFPEGTTEFEVRSVVDRDTVRQEAEGAAVMVMPSREEPFGLVAVEALGWGTPVVVSQNSGVGQALLEYASESFLPVDRYVCALTPEKIAGSIIDIIENDHSRRLFGVVADGLYERLSWTNAAHQLLSVAELPLDSYAKTIDVSLAAKRRIVAEAMERHEDSVEVRSLLLRPHEESRSERSDTMYGVPIHYGD